MHSFSLKAEEELNLSQSEKHYFGGDGDTWITSGIRDYFPQATFILCCFHLFKRLRESLPGEKDKQRIIKDLLLSNQIEEALERIDNLLIASSEQKHKRFLTNFYAYIANNREGITNQVTLEDRDITRTGAIESNVKIAIANRFKKQGRSWSKRGAYSLLKVKETIINGKWDSWWKNMRNHSIKLTPLKPPLSVSFFNQEVCSSPVVQARIPALYRSHQDKPWVGVLRKLSQKDIHNLLKELLLNHSSIYLWNKPGSSIVVIIADGDYAYEQLEVEGRQIQARVLKEYRNYHALLSVLLKDQPRDTLNELSRTDRIVLRTI